ncbi:MAG: EAL domain-containing protein [Gammaproteobacteria bacterium]
MSKLQLPFTTLSGRFASVSLIFLVLLFGLTLYSQHVVQVSANSNLTAIRKNQLLSEKLDHLTNLLEDTESLLHQYSSDPQHDLHARILKLLVNLNGHASALQTDTGLSRNNQLREQSKQLTRQTRELTSIIKQYLQVMQDVKSRYPGMPILLTYLEPSNRNFSEAVEQALQEGQLTKTKHNVVSLAHYRIMQLFQEARYAWSMQISWFRMFVANRMGAFGDPITSMKNNLVNRNLFAKRVVHVLHKLDDYQHQQLLGLQQQESLKQMHKSVDFYNRHFQQAVKIYSSAHWSEDARLQRQTLQPALQNFWKMLHQMETGIADINRAGIAKSQATANLLSRFIWLFTSLVTAMLIVAYLVFQKKIRKPLLQLTDSMQSSAVNSPLLHHANANLKEINKLLCAYNEMRQQLDNRQRRLQSILDNAAESIIIIDNNGLIEDFNKAASSLFQYHPHEVQGMPFSRLFPDDIVSPLDLGFTENSNSYINLTKNSSNGWELTGQRKDQSQFHMLLKFTEMRIGGQALYTAIVDDISERQAVMEHLRNLAEHDSLTGLYNRQYFNDEMERSIARATRSRDYQCACIYIDLDNFKYINDTMGHIEGDRLLLGIANTLKSRTRKMDVLARLGGDEFALLMHDISKEQVTTIAEQYRQAIASHSFIAGGKRIDTGCSIGVALYDLDISNKEDLLARADIACHVAKRSGRNRVYIFEHDDKNRIDSFSKEMGWARRIRHALEYDEFVFARQPMLDLKRNQIFSQELLLRMHDQETGQQLLPGGFLDSAERFGLMPDIDRWVIRHGFALINRMHSDAQGNMKYFINLSGKSIGDEGLIKHIKQQLPELKLPAENIVFEITEDVAIANLEQARKCLCELKSIGFMTALDDFGVGYSSFSYLRDLDVDFIKIDGSFINAMHEDELNFALVRAMNDICHILGKMTVAEFVQNDHALKLLREIGVDFAQGNNIAAASEFTQQSRQLRQA